MHLVGFSFFIFFKSCLSVELTIFCLLSPIIELLNIRLLFPSPCKNILEQASANKILSFSNPISCFVLMNCIFV